jgi:hypothetical protein
MMAYTIQYVGDYESQFWWEIRFFTNQYKGDVSRFEHHGDP